MRLERLVLSLVLITGAAGGALAQERLALAQPMPGIDSLQVLVDGHPGTFLFDSGLGVSTLTPAMASTIGCTPWGKLAGFRATGERLDMQRCNAATLTIGQLRLPVRQLGVFDLGKFLGQAGKGISGAVGLDAFDGRVVTLSVAEHTLTVESEKSAQHIAATEQEVPIRLVRDVDGAALGADLGVQTASGMVWLEIDTGNGGPSLIDKTVASLLGVDPGVQGKQPLDVTAGKARFGGECVVKDMIRDGNLGRGALVGWDITLDLQHGRGWIRPAAGRPS